MQGYDTRRYMWFGTKERSQWIPVPLTGATASPSGWSEGGTLLNGGGFEFNSWGSHRMYTFEWPESSSYQAAQKMASYADGTYGRGLIYFQIPTTYGKNVLPQFLADPSRAVRQEGLSLVSGIDPTGTPTSSGEVNELPVTSAHYDLLTVGTGNRGRVDSIYVPIPPGHYLRLGAVYQSTGSGGVFYQPINGGNPVGTARLSESATTDDDLHPHTVSGYDGVEIYVGKDVAGDATVTLTALSARIFDSNQTPQPVGYGEKPFGEGPYGGEPEGSYALAGAGPWVGGMGNGGCRFVGKPTLSLISGFDGGRAGYAATLREVGPWMNG